MDFNELYSTAIKEYETKNYGAALKILEEVHRLDPKHKQSYYLEGAAWNGLGNTINEYKALKKLLPLLDFSSPNGKDFAAEILRRLEEVCEKLGLWKEIVNFYFMNKKLDPLKKYDQAYLERVIFCANSIENFSAADFRILYDEYRKTLEDVVPYPKKFYDHKRIRVGFLSADFDRHPVVNWSWSLLTNLDRKIFETYFYSSVEKPDDFTGHLRKAADNWRDILNLADEEAAKIIRNDEIDILFDLSGYTAGNRMRVAAHHPASVQMSGIGYINSTGLDCFDYFLSDETCAGDENFFTEKVIKLAHSHFCYELPPLLEPAYFPPCLKNKFITFGTFNRVAKITDSILTAWKKILDAVPDSHLLLKAKVFNTEYGKNFFSERLNNFGFDIERVEMRGFTANYLPEYVDVDIALDTFPYTGGLTTCQALYMGVPVISLYGARHGSRFGLSILKNVGLEELAVNSYDEYINRAIMLASDWKLLTIFRKNLRTMMRKSPLMDSKNYLREIQDAFIKIYLKEREQ